ncbi:MAG: response regulator [Verrucomicrobiota bacterium]|nr:response regulator [Verrucomicrobiota bacterium]
MNLVQLQQARILMVDDQVASTCLVTNFLNRLGYSNLSAINDPALLFERIESLRPDLILLDLAMPHLDGFQLMEQMRNKLRPEDRVPVLVITGEATAANKRRALAAGATDILAKPFDPSEMNMRLRHILEGHFLRSEIERQNRELEDHVQERTRELAQALEDLQTAQRQMVQQERLSAFAEMAGGVVHDFSNALMTVIGYSDTLIREEGRVLDDKTTAREYLEIINRAGRDAAEVVSRLRDFYRPRDTADLFVAVDLNLIAEQAVLSTQPKWKKSLLANETAITVVTELQPVSAVVGNPSELREILTNLIFNAVDAMPHGGKITVRTRMANREAIIEVADNGSGMTPDVRNRCLNPFFSTKGDKGTGLGLAMVFGIVKRHQGTLQIDTQIGRGTSFRISLPLFAQGNQEAQDAVPSCSSSVPASQASHETKSTDKPATAGLRNHSAEKAA